MSTAMRQLARAERTGETVQVAGAAQASSLDAIFLLNCLSVGGSELKVVRLANRLNQRGIAAGIAYLNGPESLAPLLSAQVPRWHLDRTGKFSLSSLRRLMSLIERSRPRVVFAVNMYPALYVLGAAVALRERAPVIASLVNTTDVSRRLRWRHAAYKRLLRRFDKAVYGCELQRELWLDQADAVAWARSAVIYNGVDLDEFRVISDEERQALRRQYGCTRDSFVIGSVGRMTAPKNQAALVDSVAHLRARGVDAQLILVGDGPLRNELSERATALGIGAAVAFTGNLVDVRPALGAMDVFVLPSLYVETFSNAALEAMASGTAVVLSDVGGAAEMVRHAVDGWVLPRQTLEHRLTQLLTQLATERLLCVRMGQAARRRAEALFSFDAMVDQYERIIRGAAYGHRR